MAWWYMCILVKPTWIFNLKDPNINFMNQERERKKKGFDNQSIKHKIRDLNKNGKIRNILKIL